MSTHLIQKGAQYLYVRNYNSTLELAQDFLKETGTKVKQAQYVREERSYKQPKQYKASLCFIPTRTTKTTIQGTVENALNLYVMASSPISHEIALKLAYEYFIEQVWRLGYQITLAASLCPNGHFDSSNNYIQDNPQV